MLVNQSEAEGRGMPVRVEFDEEKFFFESAVTQPLFINHLKKNPGFLKEGARNQLNVVNQRSCKGI